ncbi:MULTISPECIES: hypothetical protein [Mesoplasma]|uniref:Uncharacterized protein n=1 Tax=Mesoplasma florum TaxID=2151 RepID=A0A2R3P7N5_MESFO|nr:MULTISPECIES: hypothetical protein [Mesoplasma]AVN64503.1 hypothetical protein CG003_02410 [Mesoplasma florum]
MRSNNKKIILSTKIKTTNKFLIYCKYNFFSGTNSGLMILVFFTLAAVGMLSMLAYLATKTNGVEGSLIKTSSVMMCLGFILLINSIASLNMTLNSNINKRINRIFLLSGIKRHEIKNYALIYNIILLLIQALIAIILSVIIFGIATLASDYNSFKAIINLQYFATLLLKLLSAFMLGLLMSVLLGALPKGYIKRIVMVLFFIAQYMLLSFSFGSIILADSDKVVIAWIISIIPSVSSGSIIWWNIHNWLIFVGYAYNLALISLFIWLWTIINRKLTY